MLLAKFSAIVISAVALSSSVFATPIDLTSTDDLELRGSYSLSGFGGFSSMNNFDNFYGSSNYDGSHYNQVFDSQTVVVCQTEQIEIIQQRLAVLREMARRIVTETICEVETQTIVIHQHISSIYSFYDDLHRHSGRGIGYDHSISSHFGDLVNSDGSLSTSDLGFSGSDIGSHFLQVSGDNWNDQTSPSSVAQAFTAAHDARLASRSD